METKKRNTTLWIVLAVVAVVLCCAALAVAVLAGVFWIRPANWGFGGVTEERTERSFEVGSAPRLVIDNFAGSVTIRPGDENVIQVTATKRVRGQDNMNRIQVHFLPTPQGLEIRTTRESPAFPNASVELEIRAPVGTSIDIDLGAGQVDVRGLTGSERVQSGAGDVTLRDAAADVDVHTGAGSIDVEGGTGQVRLDTGAGSIVFRGEPQGDYQFQSGVGTITLWLPADASADLNLTTGFGRVNVDFPVEGQVTDREVRGTIGGGAGATIQAHTGTGSVEVKQD
jgi:hypothetical protein